MTRIKPEILAFIMILGLLSSCDDITKNVEDKMTELDAKTEYLDSLVNRELDKVKKLDTLIDAEHFKVEKLDSLIEKNSSRIDSVAREKIRLLNELVN